MSIVKNERIYGKKLGFTIQGVDYWADVISVDLEEKESDSASVTFADFAEGGAGAGKWTMKLKAIFSTDTAALWTMLWEQRGKTVPFIVAPHGNKTANATHPHFTGKVNVSLHPPISLEAGDSKPRPFDVTYECDGPVEKKTDTSTMGKGNMEDALSDRK